jgi:hypothetical protein
MSGELKIVVNDISILQNWQKMVEERRGTLSIKTSVLLTRVLAIIGAAGVIVGAIAGVTQFIDWLQKQGAVPAWIIALLE